jgi:hypothetical protein
MPKFNAKGLLVPNSNIGSNLEEFETEFVKNIGSKVRRHLFEKYMDYTMSLKKELTFGSFFQWIDGSFVSKKSDPNDLDIVTFTNYQELDNDANKLDMFKYPASLVNFEIDAYLVMIYPQEHKNYSLYIGDRFYWMDLFNKTRRNRNGLKMQKGFLELNF